MVGETVHYVSHGTPTRTDGTRAFESVCRAAIVTETSQDPDGPGRGWFASLAVLNPSGMFFQEGLALDADGPYYAPGTWHPVHPS